MQSGLGGLLKISGQAIYLLAWVISIVVAFSEGGNWGFAFLFFGVTGPIAGLIEGIVWGNWVALWISGVGVVLVIAGSALSTDE